MTESEQISSIRHSVGRIEGLLEGLTTEVRAGFARAQTDARAQDDRINSQDGQIAAIRTSLASAAAKSEGHTEHRNFIGYVITGAASFLAAMAATYSGFFKPH